MQNFRMRNATFKMGFGVKGEHGGEGGHSRGKAMRVC